MSEREIKVGSVWRNVHGEVEVLSVMDRANPPLVCINGVSGALAVSQFRATHEWVSDPVETPKVGSWVRLDSSVYGTLYEGCFYCVVDPWPPPRDFFFPSVSVEKASERDLFTPCEPPPLVKALDKLELAVTGFVGSDYEAEALVSEWRAIKAKMGVKA